jgi:hypothetical protein
MWQTNNLVTLNHHHTRQLLGSCQQMFVQKQIKYHQEKSHNSPEEYYTVVANLNSYRAMNACQGLSVVMYGLVMAQAS